jgi:hypothetical protein
LPIHHGLIAMIYFSTESMNKLYQPTNEEVVLGMLELQSA